MTKKTIALKMLKLVFSIYVLIAVSTTIVQIFVEYSSAKKNLKSEIESYKNIFELDLSKALWDFDRDSIKRICSGILKIPIIDGLAIIDNTDYSVILSLGTSPFKKSHYIKESLSSKLLKFDQESYWYKFPIKYNIDGTDLILGNIIFHSDPSLIFMRLKASIAMLIINSLIKSIALFIIFLSIGNFILTRPLLKFIKAINRVNLEDITNCSHINIDASHELKLIETAFNNMIGRLIFSTTKLHELQKKLQETNDNLEIKINERTKELNEKNKLLEQLSITDPLTKISNRRFFDEFLKREVQRAGRIHTNIALILCDIDFFKTYNDLYGHQAGDECLKKVAMQLKKNAQRQTDCVARYGGEEFAVILPDTDKNVALAIAEKIRKNVEQSKIIHEKPKDMIQVVTISVGLAVMASSDSNLSVPCLIAQSDKALYLAKENGRNRVEIFY